MDLQKLSPLMQQYWEIKNQHLDKILLFRMGDFYEMFFDDAVKAAPILNIALTSRNKSQGQDVPMCGAPHHAIGPQINKLLQAGLKVAICDQVENPKDAKTIVRRAVTRVVTPGLVYDPDTIASHQSVYVASFLQRDGDSFDFAAVDASTGEVVTAQELSLSDLSTWIQKLSPQEFVLDQGIKLPFPIEGTLTRRDRHEDQVEKFLLNYVAETQGPDVAKTLKPAASLQTHFLKISPTTSRHLEIFKTSSGETYGSLFETLNFSKTAMGSRLLKKRLASPFSTLKEINDELDAVEKFLKDESLRRFVREKLALVGDLERRIAKLSNPLCNARDLASLGKSLIAAREIINVPDSIEKLAQKIGETLRDELPHSVKEGEVIRPGVSSALDEFVDLSTHAQDKLSQLEAGERARSGIQSLKVKYNSVFGYSFEVTKANLDRVPKHFVRRQTLAQAERFITQELSELEEKILSSQQKRFDLEYMIFKDLRDTCLGEAIKLLGLAAELAIIDVQSSFAHLAHGQNYGRPIFGGDVIDLVASRHPVLEKISRETFIPNDISLSPSECMLLTGPNMAGKSTLMRQAALIGILAQSGSFVPATTARLPLFDQIFTRIGASDHLVKGLSTFMVEMTETAEIISSATNRSLVILDEIGRGTSTYDGMSLAQAVLEYFVSKVGSYTFFATHYHELTELEKDFPSICNRHMSIQEHKGELVFLRKLAKGAASRSYGIEVAKEAGLPPELIGRAQNILKGITSKTRELKNKQLDLLSHVPEEANGLKNLADEVKAISLDRLTPLEALNKLAQFQKSLGLT